MDILIGIFIGIAIAFIPCILILYEHKKEELPNQEIGWRPLFEKGKCNKCQDRGYILDVDGSRRCSCRNNN